MSVPQSNEQMTPKTLKALRGSIAKWEEIVSGTGIDRGVDNCSLCKLFYKNNCDGCPVNDVTGEGCDGSPYESWVSTTTWGTLNYLDLGRRQAVTPEAKVAAQAELDFLKALLPKAHVTALRETP